MSAPTIRPTTTRAHRFLRRASSKRWLVPLSFLLGAALAVSTSATHNKLPCSQGNHLYGGITKTFNLDNTWPPYSWYATDAFFEWDWRTCLWLTEETNYWASHVGVWVSFEDNGLLGWENPCCVDGSCHKYSDWAFNDFYLRDRSENDARHVACHEAGHSLGLAHRDWTGSCMDSVETQDIYPDGHDVGTIKSLYQHQGC